MIQLKANTRKLFVEAMSPNNPMRAVKPTLRQNGPPNLSITGPSKNFPKDIAPVDIVNTTDMSCCGSVELCRPELDDVIILNVEGKAHLAPITVRYVLNKAVAIINF
jgi:hypothetical protein